MPALVRLPQEIPEKPGGDKSEQEGFQGSALWAGLVCVFEEIEPLSESPFLNKGYLPPEPFGCKGSRGSARPLREEIEPLLVTGLAPVLNTPEVLRANGLHVLALANQAGEGHVHGVQAAQEALPEDHGGL